jgi:hypothetical protein
MKRTDTAHRAFLRDLTRDERDAPTPSLIAWGATERVMSDGRACATHLSSRMGDHDQHDERCGRVTRTP